MPGVAAPLAGGAMHGYGLVDWQWALMPDLVRPAAPCRERVPAGPRRDAPAALRGGAVARQHPGPHAGEAAPSAGSRADRARDSVRGWHDGAVRPEGHHLGRTRGSVTTKPHLRPAVNRLRLAVHLAADQCCASRDFVLLMAAALPARLGFRRERTTAVIPHRADARRRRPSGGAWSEDRPRTAAHDAFSRAAAPGMPAAAGAEAPRPASTGRYSSSGI